VFGDLGVGAEAGAAAIGRMEKALGQNAHAFDEYGVSVVRASDGTLDAQATFLNAVDALDRIQDPAKRAAAGADIFGRGWQGMAEIIGSGAPALKSALESVQPSKIFTDADIQAGRDVRDAFDKLADAGGAPAVIREGRSRFMEFLLGDSQVFLDKICVQVLKQNRRSVRSEVGDIYLTAQNSEVPFMSTPRFRRTMSFYRSIAGWPLPMRLAVLGAFRKGTRIVKTMTGPRTLAEKAHHFRPKER
jgi:hypothetical protein